MILGGEPLIATARNPSIRRLQLGENRVAHLRCRKSLFRIARDIGGAQPLFLLSWKPPGSIA
jgi:hypothetical protein